MLRPSKRRAGHSHSGSSFSELVVSLQFAFPDAAGTLVRPRWRIPVRLLAIALIGVGLTAAIALTIRENPAVTMGRFAVAAGGFVLLMRTLTSDTLTEVSHWLDAITPGIRWSLAGVGMSLVSLAAAGSFLIFERGTAPDLSPVMLAPSLILLILGTGVLVALEGLTPPLLDLARPRQGLRTTLTRGVVWAVVGLWAVTIIGLAVVRGAPGTSWLNVSVIVSLALAVVTAGIVEAARIDRARQKLRSAVIEALQTVEVFRPYSLVSDRRLLLATRRLLMEMYGHLVMPALSGGTLRPPGEPRLGGTAAHPLRPGLSQCGKALHRALVRARLGAALASRCYRLLSETVARAAPSGAWLR